MIKKVVAFDLDGTLSQSEKYLMPAIRRALQEMGVPLLEDGVLRQMIGGTIEDNRRLVMPDAPMERFLACTGLIHKYALASIPDLVQPYPGIAECLQQLRQAGYINVLCSNATADYSLPILKAIGVEPLLDWIPPQVRGRNKIQLLAAIAEHFSPAKLVMVGDRKFDEEAARANRVPFIGCAYGLFPQEITQADAVVQAASQIPDAVEKLIG